VFVGAVPRPAVEQITRSVPFADWQQVFVGCSGSFRFDRAVRDVHPTVAVHSNDVSLLSCTLGALATGGEFPIAFKGRLAFIEDLIAGQPFMARAAAVEVALEMAKYKGANPYAQAHFAHYEERFVEFLAPVWMAPSKDCTSRDSTLAVSGSRRVPLPRSEAGSRLSRQPTRTGMSGYIVSLTNAWTNLGHRTTIGPPRKSRTGSTISMEWPCTIARLRIAFWTIMNPWRSIAATRTGAAFLSGRAAIRRGEDSGLMPPQPAPTSASAGVPRQAAAF